MPNKSDGCPWRTGDRSRGDTIRTARAELEMATVMMTVDSGSDCPMCRANEAIEASDGDGFVVARTQTGYISIFFAQYFRGHTIFTARDHAGDLHELKPQTRLVHLDEMARIAQGVSEQYG